MLFSGFNRLITVEKKPISDVYDELYRLWGGTENG
jgi:hypothetical protein